MGVLGITKQHLEIERLEVKDLQREMHQLAAKVKDLPGA